MIVHAGDPSPAHHHHPGGGGGGRERTCWSRLDLFSASSHHCHHRPWRLMLAEKLAEFGTFSGKFHACLVCG